MTNRFDGHLLATNVTTADAAVKALPGYLYAVTINPTGAVTPTVTIYDNASAASGSILAQVKIVSAVPFHLALPEGVRAAAGIYAHATAWTTLDITVYWK